MHTFTGAAAYQLSLTNRNAIASGDPMPAFDVAHVPAGETFGDQHWLVWKHPVMNWETLPQKYLADAGDSLHLRVTHPNTTLFVFGAER